MLKNDGKRRSLIMIGVVRSILLTSLVSMVHVVEVNGQAEPFDQRVPATTTAGYPSDSSPTSPSPRYPAPIINDPTAPNYGLNSSFPAGSTLNPTNIPGTATGVTSSPTTNSSAIPHPPLDPNSSSSRPPANQNPPPPLPGPSSPNNINPNNASASVDNNQQTQTIGGGLKPEILMAVVLAGCLGLVVLILGGLFIWSRCVRPRLRAANASNKAQIRNTSNTNDDDDDQKKKEDDRVETADRAASQASSSASRDVGSPSADRPKEDGLDQPVSTSV
ncbi:hypothetical protein PGT21_036407 [Puccinia graminis f. sp. tritici]|uniref:Mid2 domain-containing protein n=1 Tax=Puccinia graminis f. sp. tritici TaxID=56615 RepID=A0A5B0QQ41_PUCGR|nr:hypothetical protein PGT21_036407 [Puccinia graminis f. sp. tritici]